MTSVAKVLVAAAALHSASTLLHAGINQSTVVAPGGYIQAGSYFTTSSAAEVGGDILTNPGSGADSEEQGFAAPGSASASASAFNATVSNSGTGSTAMGFINLRVDHSSPNSAFFPLSIVNGGWKENFVVSHTTLNGTAGYMLFQIRIHGSMETTGFAGSTVLMVQPFKDNLGIAVNTHFNRGSTDGVSTGSQYVQVALASSGQSESRNVDSIVTFAVPITFGQPFTLGVYAQARAGLRSVSGVQGISTATGNFQGQGVAWHGIPAVLTASGATVTGFSIVTGSGVDWSNPYSPCGTSDFNGDGDFGTDADIEAFFACLAGNCCPTCYSGGADFNGDGDTGTDADIEAFFRVLSGGAC